MLVTIKKKIRSCKANKDRHSLVKGHPIDLVYGDMYECLYRSESFFNGSFLRVCCLLYDARSASRLVFGDSRTPVPGVSGSNNSSPPKKKNRID